MLLIAAPVFKIDFLVRNIDITAENDFALLFECNQMWHKGVHKAVFRFLAKFAARTGRKIHRNDRQRAVAHFEAAPFRIELWIAKAAQIRIGRTARVYAHAAIAFFIRKMEITVIAMRLQVFRRDIAALRPDFLNADDIRLLRPHRSPYCLRARSSGKSTEKCSNLDLSNWLTCCGFACPLVAFITCPTSALNAFVLPARNSSTHSGYAASAALITDSSAPDSEICLSPFALMMRSAASISRAFSSHIV